MVHKIYTTYIAKLKKLNISNDEIKILIMRMPPFSVKNIEGLNHVPELSPTADILLAYKKDNDWDKFEESFNEQMNIDKKMQEQIDFIVKALEYNDIYLICCEKDKDKCHRTLLANRVHNINGCEIIEL